MTGSYKQPTRAELAARHTEKQRPRGRVPVVRGGAGFADPGGVVSQAISQEQGTGARVHVAGRWPR